MRHVQHGPRDLFLSFFVFFSLSLVAMRHVRHGPRETAQGRSREVFMNLRLAKHTQNLLGFPSGVKAILISL